MGDVFARFIITYGIGSGLRGGEFSYLQQSYGYRFDLDHVKWTEDLGATGTIYWYTASGDVSADVKLRQNGKYIGNLGSHGTTVAVSAIASITGTINGDRVKAQRIAPYDLCHWVHCSRVSRRYKPIPCFVTESSKFERHFESSGPG